MVRDSSGWVMEPAEHYTSEIITAFSFGIVLNYRGSPLCSWTWIPLDASFAVFYEDNFHRLHITPA